jgi:AraC-like DNA-binding protein
MIWVYFTNKLELINPISFVAALTIGFLNIQIFLNPYILYGFKNIKYYSNDSILAKMYKININSNSLFSQEWEIDLLNKIKSLESEKKFTKKGYNLTKMASDLDIPKYQLIYFFREISDESFTEWKNRKRILFAIQLIDKGYLNTLTVETLSQECGYKSRSNFSLAFLHSTGKKLSDYVK